MVYKSGVDYRRNNAMVSYQLVVTHLPKCKHLQRTPEHFKNPPVWARSSVADRRSDGLQNLEPAGQIKFLEDEGEGGIVPTYPLHWGLKVQEAPLLWVH